MIRSICFGLVAALPLLAHRSIVHFEPNHGQADRQVRFVARAGGAVALLAPDQVALPEVRFKMAGADPKAEGVAEKSLSGCANYFLGTTYGGTGPPTTSSH